MIDQELQDMIANFNAKFEELDERIGELKDKIERLETDVEDSRNGGQ